MIPNEKAVIKELKKAYRSIAIARKKMGNERIRSSVELARTIERENKIYEILTYVEGDLNFAIILINEGLKRDFAIEADTAKMYYNLFDKGE